MAADITSESMADFVGMRNRETMGRRRVALFVSLSFAP
jgi:hypothetical protein